MFVRKVVAALALALVLSTVPQTALADTLYTYNDTVVGRELFATSTLGVFAGTATGSLPGAWSAYIYHTVLSTSATITGGSFSLATPISGGTATVNGTFAYGGTVTQRTGGTGVCPNQTYDVQGTLTGVGVGGGTGTGAFAGTLTHFRYPVWGYCITYKATITGTVGLTY